jgi:hypothetical protein
VDVSGSYLVKVTDINRCRATSQPVLIAMSMLPDPVISGSTKQCENVAFILNGFAGDDLTYSWSSTAGHTGNEAQIEASLPPGTHTFTLTISKGACSKYTTFVVDVSPPPAAPDFSYQVTDCENYTVKLEVNNVQQGSYNWSNGAYGPSIDVNEGGPYKLWYTDPGGCTSSWQQYVPKDPESYLWIVPTGCYRRCMPESGEIHVPGPIIPFAYWEWNTGQSGSFTVPDPLVINGDGTYNLLLDDGNCQVRSGDLNFTVADNCGELCDQVEIKENFTDISNCHLEFNLDVDNNSPDPVSFAIWSDAGGVATIQPVPNLVLPGTGTQSFQVIWDGSPLTTGGGSITFTVRFWRADGTWCDKTFSYEFWCERKEFRTTYSVKETKEGTQEVVTDEPAAARLTLAPNPAGNQATLRYQFASKLRGSTKVEVYNMMGVKMYSAPVKDMRGSLVLPTVEWANGMYQVLLWDGGKLVKTTKLLVAR